jgi:eukaryotic-like serine/threonine-protein kinase
MQRAQQSNLVYFGPFRLDLKAGELHRDGRRVRLQEQPFRVLEILLKSPGDIVTREELRKKLWPNDTIVEFDHSINAAIKRLRDVLGDKAEEPKYIETVARRGYRLLVQVQWDITPTQPPSEAERSLTSEPTAGGLIGKKVSHYRVLEMVGGGGMGVVYKAQDLKLGRNVALKFLPEDVARDHAALERFQREARAASLLNHANICTVYEFGEYEDQPFIAMELLKGQTLRQVIAENTFATRELLDLAIQIAKGLEAAHAEAIIHRDIKPANIFITTHQQAKILDFGLVKLNSIHGTGLHVGTENVARLADTPTLSADELNLTRSGQMMGTACYMSPEQVRGEKLDARTDLFSFGLVLYEMATGRQAYTGTNTAEVHNAILSRSPVPARQLNSRLPSELARIIGKAIEKDREARYRTAQVLRSDLERLRARETWIGAFSTSLWHRHSFAFLGILALALLSFAILWFAKRQPPVPLEMKLRQLTMNSSENPVAGGAISPDGKYLAYADLKGMHIKLIETGEMHTIPNPDDLEGPRISWDIIRWFPDGTKFLATLHAEPGKKPSTWTGSLLGGAPRKLRDDAYGYSISPDGQSIAFVRNRGSVGNRELWLMDSNGEQARKLFEGDENTMIGNPHWSPNGELLAYFQLPEAPDQWRRSVQIRAIKGGPATVVVSSDRLREHFWLPDGRLIYALAEEGNENSCNYWAMRIDQRAAKPIEKPRRLTNWGGFCLGGTSTSVTADGKRLAFQESTHKSTVYVAELRANNTRIGNPRLLTPVAGENMPMAWTSDSRAVIFNSTRNGHWGIFRQFLGADTAEPIIAGPIDALNPQVTPDGNWVLYERDWHDVMTLMRAPAAGGPSESLQLNDIAGCHCPVSPAKFCVFAEHPDGKELIFSELDALKGRGRELSHFKTDPGAEYDWSLSPDGSRIAIRKNSEPRLQILSLLGLSAQEVIIKPAARVQILGSDRQDWRDQLNMNWAADGKGLFTSARLRGSAVLLYVDLKGNAYPLWEQAGSLGTWGIASPDGRHLALSGWTIDTNIWMMENF